ncbi:MAG: rRNA maturation RNase YbeY [Polyangiaceae bacterium]|nr:rRNA maturation RNase YbeY [Polyangiaceae bacterium]
MTALVRRQAPGSPPLRGEQVRRLAERMLSYLNLEDSELSILLTNDEFIHTLNLEHREKDKPTDVLSFPLNEFSAPEVPLPGQNLLYLGDVVISLDTAERQAKGRKRELLAEVRFLLAHGLLHLLGYDHAEPEEKKEMTKRTRQLVAHS